MVGMSKTMDDFGHMLSLKKSGKKKGLSMCIPIHCRECGVCKFLIMIKLIRL
jgi:hypothetical protein